MKQKTENKEEKPKVVILDDNPLSIISYAKEYPENWKKICKALNNTHANEQEEKQKGDDGKMSCSPSYEQPHNP